MKEQEKTPEKKKKTNQLEISNLINKEFKVMSIKMFYKFARKIQKHSENFNEDLENMRNNQSELKNTTP